MTRSNHYIYILWHWTVSCDIYRRYCVHWTQYLRYISHEIQVITSVQISIADLSEKAEAINCFPTWYHRSLKLSQVEEQPSWDGEGRLVLIPLSLSTTDRLVGRISTFTVVELTTSASLLIQSGDISTKQSKNHQNFMELNTKVHHRVTDLATPTTNLCITRTCRVQSVEASCTVHKSWSQAGTSATTAGTSNSTDISYPDIPPTQEDSNLSAWMRIRKRWPVDIQTRMERCSTTWKQSVGHFRVRRTLLVERSRVSYARNKTHYIIIDLIIKINALYLSKQ